jgi:hypothetical protein
MPVETVMSQPRMPFMAIAVFLVGTGACVTMKPPAVNNGPAWSSNGVQVAVLRQVCAETMRNEFETFIDETVELQVRNGSPNPVRIHRDRIRLLGPYGGVYTTGASATDFLTVGSGETQTFEVTFTAHAELDCNKAMQLDPGAGITSQDAPVALRPVSFVPLALR